MRAKVYEMQFFSGIALFLISTAILLSTTLISSPVKVSEKGLLFDGIAVALLFFAANLISKSIIKR